MKRKNCPKDLGEGITSCKECPYHFDDCDGVEKEYELK